MWCDVFFLSDLNCLRRIDVLGDFMLVGSTISMFVLKSPQNVFILERKQTHLFVSGRN